MKIDSSGASIAPSFHSIADPFQIKTQNREIIQAVRAINASVKLGDNNELTFSLDRQTRRTVIKIVDRITIVSSLPQG